MSLDSFRGRWYIYKISLGKGVFARRETQIKIQEEEGIWKATIDAKSGERQLSLRCIEGEIQGRGGKLRLRACLLPKLGIPVLFGHLSHTGDIVRRDAFVGFTQEAQGSSHCIPIGVDMKGFVLPLHHPPQVKPTSDYLRPVSAKVQNESLHVKDGDDTHQTEALSTRAKAKGQWFRGGFLKSGSIKDFFVCRTFPACPGADFSVAIGFSHVHEKTSDSDEHSYLTLGYPNCTDPVVIVYPPPPPPPEGEEERGREP